MAPVFTRGETPIDATAESADDQVRVLLPVGGLLLALLLLNTIAIASIIALDTTYRCDHVTSCACFNDESGQVITACSHSFCHLPTSTCMFTLRNLPGSNSSWTSTSTDGSSKGSLIVSPYQTQKSELVIILHRLAEVGK